MHPLIKRFVIAVIMIPPLLFVGLKVYRWWQEEYGTVTIEPLDRTRVQYPNDHYAALEALKAFRALPEAERQAMVAGIKSSLGPVADWVVGTNAAPPDIMCLGEDHDEYTRRFLAQQIFNRLKMDVLHLEVDDQQLLAISRQFERGKDYVRLLDADIGASLRAIQGVNPALRVYGIEESVAVRAARAGDADASREDAIVANFDRVRGAGDHHVVLLGALHCEADGDWFFARLKKREPPSVELLGVRVLGEHQFGPLEAFIYFLDEIGVGPGHFVIADPAGLPEQVRTWFPALQDQVLRRFDVLIVWRA